MGRGATKAAGNVYYEARIEAAKWDEKLASRAGAAEALHVSEDVIIHTENNLYKHLPVETAVLMADRYNAPQLLNYYCTHECPIGCRHSIATEVVDLDRVTVKYVRAMQLEKLSELQRKLLDRSGSKPAEKIGQYIQDMTETIDKSELQQDTFLYRGVDRWALSKMLGVDYTTLGKQNPGAYIGKEISDNAFMSCSSAEGIGFDTSGVYLKIYCPAGTKAIYAEPFSKYGNGAKRDWDGESRQTSFSKEFETILQRGTRMQITNMSRDEYGSYSVECQVLAQEYE